MKARFFAIAAMVLGMVSCAKDFAPEANYGGEVDFTLAVSAPELAATRAGVDGQDDGVNGHNSAYGAIDYLTGTDWDGVNLRYILEVYDVADDYTNATPIKDRQVKIVDKYEPVKFELRLAPKRNYHFVVFADFVAGNVTDETPTEDAQRDLGVHHVIGATLGDITIKNDKINDECADAYFGTLDYNPSHNTHNNNNADEKPLILKRPYSKVRVVATDLAELNLNVEPASVQVVYTASHATAFNAVNGTISSFTSEKLFEGNYNALFKDVEKGGLSNHFYTEDYDSRTAVSKSGVERHTHMTLFTDYILATDEQNTIQFTMTVFDKKLEDPTKQPIKTTAFNTQIPVQRNYLTTIIGNVLTTATEIEVSIDDNFASELNDENVNVKERILLETLINGGVFDLTEDLTITAPTRLKGDAVIRLNGYTLTYDIPADKESDDNYAIMTRVENGSTLTFVGEGEVVSEGYIASVNEGGVLNISEGTFESKGCTVFQSNGGEINISGGEFKAAEYDGNHRYTINFVDSKKKVGLIEISGGRFYKYNPSESHSEVPAMDFCKNGFWGVEDGDYYKVVPQKHVDLFVDHAVVYSAEGLLQWAYIVNNGAISAFDGLEGYNAATFDKKAYGLKVMANIKMLAKTVVADAAKETYVFTDEAIEVIDGVATGSNWIPVCGVFNDYDDGYRGWVDGQNKKISGLRINSSSNLAGFIGVMYDSEGASVKNVTFDDAVVKGDSYVGVVAGLAQNGITIDNIKIANSKVVGTGNNVGGVVGRNYRRWKPEGNIYEQLCVVSNCSTDKNTTVKGVNYVGGIVGKNYGAVVMDCVNNADVDGSAGAGGIVGRNRTYWNGAGAYVVGCYSSADAVIRTTSTNEYQNGVGGIVGYAHMNDEHNLSTPSANVWVVACASESEVYGLFKGALVGHAAAENSTVTAVCASWATSKLGGKEDTRYDGAFVFASPADATQTEVDAMNQAIENFNGSNENTYNINYLKRWELTANGPVLK